MKDSSFRLHSLGWMTNRCNAWSWIWFWVGEKNCHNDIIGTMDEWNKDYRNRLCCVNQHCISWFWKLYWLSSLLKVYTEVVRDKELQEKKLKEKKMIQKIWQNRWIWGKGIWQFIYSWTSSASLKLLPNKKFFLSLVERI